MSEYDIDAADRHGGEMSFAIARFRGLTCCAVASCECGAPCVYTRNHIGDCRYLHHPLCDGQAVQENES